MATTFQKRQKEMKRMEKKRIKDERRAQRKLERNAAASGLQQVEATHQDAEKANAEVGPSESPESLAEQN